MLDFVRDHDPDTRMIEGSRNATLINGPTKLTQPSRLAR
jgi:hypothetical protein